MSIVSKKKAGSFYSVDIRRVANGYLVRTDNNNSADYVFKTDAALFKFLRKHFCEGHK